MIVYFKDMPECQQEQLIDKITGDLDAILLWDRQTMIRECISSFIVGANPQVYIMAYDHRNTGDYLPRFISFCDYKNIIIYINSKAKTSGSTFELNPTKHG